MRAHYFQVQNGQFGPNKNFFRKSTNIFLIYICCPTALYMLNMKEMIRAEIKKIDNLWKWFAPADSQTNGQRDRMRKKFGKRLFLKRYFGNSFYSIHFSCGLVPYHQTKIKLKFKSRKFEISRYAVGHKIELKCLICHKQGPSLGNMYTSLLSAHCTTSLCQI